MRKKINPQVKAQAKIYGKGRGVVCAELTVTPTQGLDHLYPLSPVPSPRKRGGCHLQRNISLPLLLTGKGKSWEKQLLLFPSAVPPPSPCAGPLTGTPALIQPSDTLSLQPVPVSGHSLCPVPSAVSL